MKKSNCSMSLMFETVFRWVFVACVLGQLLAGAVSLAECCYSHPRVAVGIVASGLAVVLAIVIAVPLARRFSSRLQGQLKPAPRKSVKRQRSKAASDKARRQAAANAQPKRSFKGVSQKTAKGIATAPADSPCTSLSPAESLSSPLDFTEFSSSSSSSSTALPSPSSSSSIIPSLSSTTSSSTTPSPPSSSCPSSPTQGHHSDVDTRPLDTAAIASQLEIDTPAAELSDDIVDRAAALHAANAVNAQLEAVAQKEKELEAREAVCDYREQQLFAAAGDLEDDKKLLQGRVDTLLAREAACKAKEQQVADAEQRLQRKAQHLAKKHQELAKEAKRVAKGQVNLQKNVKKFAGKLQADHNTIHKLQQENQDLQQLIQQHEACRQPCSKPSTLTAHTHC
eukprot:jgi/Chrzof1/13590/Cz08g03130.t1